MKSGSHLDDITLAEVALIAVGFLVVRQCAVLLQDDWLRYAAFLLLLIIILIGQSIQAHRHVCQHKHHNHLDLLRCGITLADWIDVLGGDLKELE